MDFMGKNQRNPPRQRLEEHGMLNWVKQQRKMKKKGELKVERAVSLCGERKALWGNAPNVPAAGKYLENRIIIPRECNIIQRESLFL